MTQGEIDAYWEKQSRVCPIPEKFDVWARGPVVRVVLSIGQDMDVTYTETGIQGIQWQPWIEWVKWIKGGERDARIVGKVVAK